MAPDVPVERLLTEEIFVGSVVSSALLVRDIFPAFVEMCAKEMISTLSPSLFSMIHSCGFTRYETTGKSFFILVEEKMRNHFF